MSTALVTGGSRGIGRAVCAALAAAGYDVLFSYSKDEEGAKQTLRLIEEAGAGGTAVRCDVSDEAQVRALFAAAPGLEVLVNNAGVSSFGLLQDTSLSEWRRVFSVNTEGAFLCMREAIPKLLRRGGGCIVNVSSVWGEAGASCEAAYSASKAALIGLSKAAAKELAPAGIRVNCVSCGMIDTQMNARLSDEARAQFCAKQPIAREGTPEEVAAAVLFLVRSRYITGEVLRADGGALL